MRRPAPKKKVACRLIAPRTCDPVSPAHPSIGITTSDLPGVLAPFVSIFDTATPADEPSAQAACEAQCAAVVGGSMLLFQQCFAIIICGISLFGGGGMLRSYRQRKSSTKKKLSEKALIPLPPTGFASVFCANAEGVQSNPQARRGMGGCK